MKSLFSTVILAISVSGCSTQSIYKTFDVSKGESPMVDIRQRAVIVAPNKVIKRQLDANGNVVATSSIDKGVIVCAEPSPDAMASTAYEMVAKGEVPDRVAGELSLAIQDSAAFTGLRTQSIQLLRDFGYRLCESHMSGAISAAQYDLLMRRFQKNTVALLAIEQLTGTVRVPPIALTSSGKASLAQSLSEQRSEREKVNDKIFDLEQQKGAIKGSRDAAKAANPAADTSDMDKKIANIDGKIASLKEDISVIDRAIEETKGGLVEGKTEVTINSGMAGAQRSDDYLQKVSDVVKEIVNNVVLSDDKDQLCMAALQVPNQTAEQQAFSAWCIKSLNARAAADELYVEQLGDDLRQAKVKLSAAGATPVQKAEAQAEIEKIKENLKKESSGRKTYIYSE